MASLDQERARLAYEHVARFKDKAGDKKYATMVHKLPALLHAAGLCQALHYVDSRGDAHQKQLLEHLAAQLRRVDGKISDATSLLNAVRTADLPVYLRLTHETHACASWYRRMVQGVLKVQMGEEDEGAADA